MSLPTPPSSRMRQASDAAVHMRRTISSPPSPPRPISPNLSPPHNYGQRDSDRPQALSLARPSARPPTNCNGTPSSGGWAGPVDVPPSASRVAPIVPCTARLGCMRPPRTFAHTGLGVLLFCRPPLLPPSLSESVRAALGRARIRSWLGGGGMCSRDTPSPKFFLALRMYTARRELKENQTGYRKWSLHYIIPLRVRLQSV